MKPDDSEHGNCAQTIDVRPVGQFRGARGEMIDVGAKGWFYRNPEPQLVNARAKGDFQGPQPLSPTFRTRSA